MRKKTISYVLIVSFLIAVELCAAVPLLLKHSIDYDEAITLLVVSGQPDPIWPEMVVPAGNLKHIFQSSAGPVQIARILRKSDVHPPLFFWLLAGWRKIFGNGIEAARFFGLLCVSCAACLLAVMIYRADGDIVTGLLSAVIFILSPLGISTAIAARPNALTLLFIVAATWAAYASTSVRPRAPTSRVANYLPLFCGLLSSLAVLSNYLAAIFMILLGLWVICVGIARRSLRDIVFFAIGSAVPLTISVWMLTGQLGSRPNQYAAFNGISLLAKLSLTTLNELANNFPFLSASGPYLSRAALIVVSIVILTGIAVAWLDKRGEPGRKTLWFLILYLGIGYIVGLFTISFLQNKDLTYGRYTYVAIPFLASLMAAGSSVRIKNRRVGPLIFAFPILAFQIYWLYEVHAGIRQGQQWRNVAAFAEHQLSTNDTLVLIDVGHGRGVPSAMIYELPEYEMVRMITGNTDTMKVLNEIKPFRNLLMVMSWQPEGQERMLALEKRLLNTGSYEASLSQGCILMKKLPPKLY